MSDGPIIIDRSEAQKRMRLEKLRAELAELGYAVIRKDELGRLFDTIQRMHKNETD